MSVLIKGMEMPTSCDVCFMRDACEYSMPLGKRLTECPLVEIPPHGRLIDADALNYSNTDYCGNHFVYMVDIEDSPTIIEAEDNTDFFAKGHLHLGYVEESE